jgi:hypothetical protein
MRSDLEKAMDDLNLTIARFNDHMSKQMLLNMEIKKRLAENRKALEELLHAQKEDDSRRTEDDGCNQ